MALFGVLPVHSANIRGQFLEFLGFHTREKIRYTDHEQLIPGLAAVHPIGTLSVRKNSQERA